MRYFGRRVITTNETNRRKQAHEKGKTNETKRSERISGENDKKRSGANGSDKNEMDQNETTAKDNDRDSYYDHTKSNAQSNQPQVVLLCLFILQ